MKNKILSKGFTLIELLVVVAIIALMSSVILVGIQQSRMKSRDARRIGDITQMSSVLELFYNTNKGYPAATTTPVAGTPENVSPGFAAKIPVAPLPGDGVCGQNYSPCGGANQPACVSENTYFYVPSGTPYTIGSTTYYPDYSYYFCLGNQTGSISGGPHVLTSKGLR